MQNTDPIFTQQDVLEVLGMESATLQNWLKAERKVLPSSFIGSGKRRFYSANDIVALGIIWSLVRLGFQVSSAVSMWEGAVSVGMMEAAYSGIDFLTVPDLWLIVSSNDPTQDSSVRIAKTPEKLAGATREEDLDQQIKVVIDVPRLVRATHRKLDAILKARTKATDKLEGPG